MFKKTNEHTISIDIRTTEKRIFIEVNMVGQVSNLDYKIFAPMIDVALSLTKGLEADLLVDMRKFTGWDFAATLDDIQFKINHKNSFDKIAIVGDKKSEEISTSIVNHFSKGKSKFFKKRGKAIDWLLK